MTQHTVRDPDQARTLGRRASVATGIAVVALLVLVVRLYILQVSRGDLYAFKSRSNFVKELSIPSDRGMILDRRGKILVDNRPAFDVAITPAFCKDLDEVLARLAAYLTLGPEEIEKVRGHFGTVRGLARFKPVVVKRDVSRDELDRIEAHGEDLEGVDILSKMRRNFRFGTLAAHLLGYVSEVSPEELRRAKVQSLDYKGGDFVGRQGLERKYERTLRGKDGTERVVADAKGRRLSDVDAEGLIPENERFTAAVPGNNLVLSVDARLQDAVEKAFTGRAGAIVAMDPRSGFVLAMHSTPGFDPAKMSGRLTEVELDAIDRDPLKPLIQRAVQEHYSPGSTFKVVTALAALQEGVTTPQRTVFCDGGYTVGNRRWRCHSKRGHGAMDLKHAIKYSCDTYFYAMAERLGLDKIAAYSRALGLGARTGIELGTEVPGFIPTSTWYLARPVRGTSIGGAVNAAIGQGAVNVTPVQLAVVYSAVANGGHVFRPQLVRRLESADGKVLEELGPAQVRALEVKPQHLATVMQALRAVIEEPGGTGFASRIEGVPMAGKTGTAQVVEIGETRVRDLDYWQNDHAWFVGIAPADDPELVVVVLNEHGGHGGSASGPIARAVVEAYMEIKKADEAERAARPTQAPPAQPAKPFTPAPGPASPAPEPVTARNG